VEQIIDNFVYVNLLLYIIAFVVAIVLWKKKFKKETGYFIPIWIYLLNLIFLYLGQAIFEIPSIPGKVWSILSRFYEVIVIIGIIVIILREPVQEKGK
jgi:hypothetical protein